MARKKLNVCLGIDLGTTNSVVSYFFGKDFKIIENNDGLRITPSFVFLDEKGGYETGLSAKRRAKKSPRDVFSSFKRLMGLKYSDLKSLNVPYKIIEGKNGMCEVQDSKGKNYDVIFLSSLLLKTLKEDAERVLRGEITKAVITVPAYFNNDQRNATKEAAKLAGLEVERLIVEPSAAATMASGIKNGKILVYDLGGGTFDVSIIDKKTDSKGESVLEVMSTEGDTQLGGRDFDNLLFKMVDDKVKSLTGKSLNNSPRAIIETQEAIEAAKKQLSNRDEADIVVPYLDPKIFGQDEDDNPYSVDLSITRSEYENLVNDLISKTLRIVDLALNSVNLEAKDIDEVLLVGGMTRTPLVQNKLGDMFGETKLNSSWNPDEVVSLGAAQQGAFIYGYTDKAPLVLNNLPLSLGIETLGGVYTKLLHKNKTVPCEAEEIFSTAADNQTRVTISVFQGERPMANDNHSLGSFDLVGIEPQQRGIPKIKVKFEVDENGMLNVSAQDEKSGKIQNLQLNFNLSQEQIEKMVEEAEKFKEVDEKRKNFSQKKSSLLQLAYSAKKEMEDSLKETKEHSELSNLIDRAETFSGEEDFNKIEELNSLFEELRKLSDEYLKIKHDKAASKQEGQETPQAEEVNNSDTSSENEEEVKGETSS